MLVKTQGLRRGSAAAPLARPWVAHMGPGDKVVVSTLRQGGYQPVAEMAESTVMVYYHCDPISPPKRERVKMRGARRVVTFCLLTACLPVMMLIIPLYLRNNVFAERHFNLMKHDTVPLTDGISSFFCQRHTVEAVEGWLSAYQMQEKPALHPNHRQLPPLERPMNIPDDKLEYWGFNLLPGSTIALAVCASSPGARLLVVRGEKNLELCGLLHHSTTGAEPSTPAPAPRPDDDSVVVLFQQEQEGPSTAAETGDENHGGEVTDPPTSANSTHPLRHVRSKLRHPRDIITTSPKTSFKSDVAHFESGIEHGGNTNNYTESIEGGDNSLSSFESELLDCFSGKTLFQRGFASGGKACETANSDWTGSLRISLTVRTPGHIYYVFYSDNDLEINKINARFNINATRYDFSLAQFNCENETKCSFDLSFFGGDGTMYVEAPTDVLLVSTCEPRIAVYLLFPVCALVCVLIFGLL